MLRLLDAITVVVASVTALGFIVYWLAERQRSGVRGFRRVRYTEESPRIESAPVEAPQPLVRQARATQVAAQAVSAPQVAGNEGRSGEGYRGREWLDGEDVPWWPDRSWFYRKDLKYAGVKARFLDIWRERCALVCMCCGMDVSSWRDRNVDHIYPVRFHWSKRYDLTNLQVLCRNCNKRKKSIDASDYRPAEFKAYMASIAVSAASVARPRR